MREQIIDIVEVSGYTEVTDADMTFEELEVDDESFLDIIQTIEDEFDIRVSKKDAEDLYAGSVNSLIAYVEDKVNG